MKGAIILIIIFGFSFVQFISTTTYTCDPTVSCGCSSVSTVITKRIVGGRPAANNSWEWMVSIQLNNSHICGASLLTSEYAVTAAHCLDAGINNPSVLSILAGTNYLNDLSGPTVQRRIITKVIRDPNYDPTTWVNDIAIIQFSPLTVSSDSKLAFICLPNANQDPFQTNDNLVAIGWGVTFVFSSVASNYLQQVTVQVFSSTSPPCVPPYITNASSQFCAGVNGGGKDTCYGDSGDPLMALVNDRWVLAGITSTGHGCAFAGSPGVYTRVSAFIPFIDVNANLSMPETTTASVITTLNNQTGWNGSERNIINKSIVILMFVFSSFVLLPFSY